jgi:hypothetical protein
MSAAMTATSAKVWMVSRASMKQVQRHPEEVARAGERPSRRMERHSVFVAILRDARAPSARELLRMTASLLRDRAIN